MWQDVAIFCLEKSCTMLYLLGKLGEQVQPCPTNKSNQLQCPSGQLATFAGGYDTTLWFAMQRDTQNLQVGTADCLADPGAKSAAQALSRNQAVVAKAEREKSKRLRGTTAMLRDRWDLPPHQNDCGDQPPVNCQIWI